MTEEYDIANFTTTIDPVPIAQSRSSRPVVIDIYHGDPVVDFAKVKAFGIVGVIHKASQGHTADHAYAGRRKLALREGLKWGAYCFLNPGDPIGQADYFLSVASPDAETLVALDWERGKGGAPSSHEARTFLEHIASKLDRKAKIYSGNVAKENIKGKDPFFSAHDLWLAQYGTHWTVQESWRWPWLWQNNGDASGPGPHHIPGISGLCDNNRLVPPMTVEKLLETWAA